ncbi:A-kinase anchor protein 7-like [Penaeus japonicus]|uniref:A-kinase anchor protein 7-like n=1 Tax=Penaeus japonicus TaxID=27405 RepID=UPI001C713EEB|nr:A-kinase anchor protein 7-like [Penaeus japonicus]
MKHFLLIPLYFIHSCNCYSTGAEEKKPKNQERDSGTTRFEDESLSLSQKVQEIPLGTSGPKGLCDKALSVDLVCSVKDVTRGKKRKKGQRENRRMSEREYNGKIQRKSPRPNYFVGIQVSDCEIHRAVVRIQEAVVAFDPLLYQTLIDVASSHITLLVMHIDSDATLSIASSALETCWDILKEDIGKRPIKMTFSGIGSFSDRVIYAKLREDEHYLRLLRLAKDVRRVFSRASVCLPDDKPMQPHLTIAKMSKAGQKVADFPRKIDPVAYYSLKGIHLGCQAVSGLQLLSMTKPKDKERYYYCAKEIIFDGSYKERGDHSLCCFPRRPSRYA